MHLIYGPQPGNSKSNRNQKKNLQNQQQTLVSQTSQALKEINFTPTVPAPGDQTKPYSSSNKQVRRIGQTGVSVDAKRGIGFRHGYKDPQ